MDIFVLLLLVPGLLCAWFAVRIFWAWISASWLWTILTIAAIVIGYLLLTLLTAP